MTSLTDEVLDAAMVESIEDVIDRQMRVPLLAGVCCLFGDDLKDRVRSDLKLIAKEEVRRSYLDVETVERLSGEVL